MLDVSQSVNHLSSIALALRPLGGRPDVVVHSQVHGELTVDVPGVAHEKCADARAGLGSREPGRHGHGLQHRHIGLFVEQGGTKY